MNLFESRAQVSLFTTVFLVGVLGSLTIAADVVRIEQVVVRLSSAQAAQFDVTLRHADDGWEHFADRWRVVDGQSSVLGERVLHHPHVNEQPFTRSLFIAIPDGLDKVFVEARDSVHGWSSDRVMIDLKSAAGERYRIEY